MSDAIENLARGEPPLNPLKRNTDFVCSQNKKTQHCSSEQVEPLFFYFAILLALTPESYPNHAENIAETVFQLFFSSVCVYRGAESARKKQHTTKSYTLINAQNSP